MFTQLSKINNSRGFTLIELIIVLSILIILVSVVGPLYSSIQLSAQINDADTSILQIIRKARERAVARVNDSAHGIYLNINPSGADSVILYQGDSYATRDSSYDEVKTLPEVLVLSSSITGNEINFSKGLGVPSSTGDITITHSVSGVIATITINSVGVAQIN